MAAANLGVVNSSGNRIPASGASFTELGSTGLKRQGNTGFIYEEFIRDLEGARGVRAYKEMAHNDATVGAVLYAIDKVVRNVNWRVEGPQAEWNDFIESCMGDCSHTWEDFLSEVLSMLVYGWAWHEVVLKRRTGPSDDASLNSQYNDGKIGWRKLAPRSQDSRFQWQFGNDGSVSAFVQMAPPKYEQVVIPIQNSLLFRTVSAKNSPEGASILRTAYRSWFFLKRIEEIEAVGIERDLAGLPVMYVSKELLDAYRNEFMDIVRNVRRNEQEGMLLPLAYDDKGNQLIKFELVSSGGNRQFDTTQIIKRLKNTIATTCLADFLLLGQDKVGSFALSTNKTDMFALSLGTYLKAIASVMNRFAIPRLLAVNGANLEAKDMPKIVPGTLQAVDLASMGLFIANLAKAGVLTLPDPDLEAHLRESASLPSRTEAMANRELNDPEEQAETEYEEEAEQDPTEQEAA